MNHIFVANPSLKMYKGEEGQVETVRMDVVHFTEYLVAQKDFLIDVKPLISY